MGILFFISAFTANSANIAEDLTKLNKLYKEGAITKEEFSKAKSWMFTTAHNAMSQARLPMPFSRLVRPVVRV